MAESQKSADVKHFLTIRPHSAKHEKWREGVWCPRKTHVFGVLVRQLAERVRENLGQYREFLLTVATANLSQWMGSDSGSRSTARAGRTKIQIPRINSAKPLFWDLVLGSWSFRGGSDYLLLPDGPPPLRSEWGHSCVAAVLATLRQLLSHSPAPLTRQEILARWPEPHPPHPDSLWRSLTRGCELGLLVRTGAGTKAEAFRYGLAEGGSAT